MVSGKAAEGGTGSNTEDPGAGQGGAVLGRAAEGATKGNTEDRGAGLGGAVTGRAAEGATRSITEARGAGLGGAVKGSAAEGATRSNTEAQGAGLGGAVKGRAAEGAMGSNTEDRGAGLGGAEKGSAAEGTTRSNTEAQGAGLGGAVKGRAAEGAMGSNTEDRGAGLGGTVLGGVGRSEEQDANDPRRDIQHAKAIDTEDITAKDNNAKDTNGSDSYPLVGPRPEEAPDSDYCTLEQSTGTEGSPAHTLDVMNKPLYTQHLEDDERDDERHDDQDAIDPGQDIPHAKNVTAKTITAQDITAKDIDAKDINGGNSYPLVGPRPEEAPDSTHSTLVQSTGADGSPVHPLNVMDKPFYSQHLEDEERDGERHDDQDGSDPRQGIHHAKSITAKTITAKHQEDDERDDERHDDQDAIDSRQDNQHAKNINAKTITAKENEVHTRVPDKTHTGTYAKDLTKASTKTHTREHNNLMVYGADEKEHNRNRAAMQEGARKKYVTWRKSKTMMGGPEVKWFGKILSGAGVATDPDKILQIVQAGKSETIEDVRTLLQVETNNAKYGFNHKEDQTHEEVIGTRRKRLTKDGGHRNLAKTHDGKGFIHDPSQHDANKEAETGTGDNEDETGNNGATGRSTKDHAKMLAKNHNGEPTKSLIHGDSHHGPNKEAVTDIGNDEDETLDLNKRLAKNRTGRCTEDGGHRCEEERDASYQFAKRLTKTHTGNLAKNPNGKGFIHDLTQHGANKKAETGTGDNEDKTGNNGATGRCTKDHAKRLAKDHNGEPTKGLIHGDSHHGSNKEAVTDIGDDEDETRDLNKRLAKDHARTLAKTHNGMSNRGLIHDDSHHGGNKEAGKDIGDDEDETGINGATGIIGATHNDPHHSNHGAPSKGPDEEEQERQVVDRGEDTQAREELGEGHHGDNVPTEEEGDGDEQGTRAEAGGGGGGGDGEM